MAMHILTREEKNIFPFFKKIILPKKDSHKGENGKVLIIGGSSLFHAASLWAAEVASYFVDIVHYYSTIENERVFINLKSKFQNGIVIAKKDLLNYVKEDDAILIGPGMMREPKAKIKESKLSLDEIFSLKDEGKYTYYLTQFLIEKYHSKKFIFDAGALQMMKKEWLLKLEKKPILTPHLKEFEELFNLSLVNKTIKEREKIVKMMAYKYNCIILLKGVIDIISDGKKIYLVEGGNAGLTKGGTGDVLAGLTLSFYAKNDPLLSAIFASFLLKKSADELFKDFGYWYNINKIIEHIPKVLNKLFLIQ
jgi:NAD(P)H-hydrate epimerase